MKAALLFLFIGLLCVLEASCAHAPKCKWDTSPTPDSGCPDALRWGE